MTLITKRHRLSTSKYIEIAMLHTVRRQWWLIILLSSIGLPTLYTGHRGWIVGAAVALTTYLLFWWIQFYGLTVLPENQLFFERLSYEIDNHQVVVRVTSRRGIAIPWHQVKSARTTRDAFLLTISPVQFIYLPHKIFAGEHKVDFFKKLLEHKKLR